MILCHRFAERSCERRGSWAQRSKEGVVGVVAGAGHLGKPKAGKGASMPTHGKGMHHAREEEGTICSCVREGKVSIRG